MKTLYLIKLEWNKELMHAPREFACHSYEITTGADTDSSDVLVLYLVDHTQVRFEIKDLMRMTSNIVH